MTVEPLHQIRSPVIPKEEEIQSALSLSYHIMNVVFSNSSCLAHCGNCFFITHLPQQLLTVIKHGVFVELLLLCG